MVTLPETSGPVSASTPGTAHSSANDSRASAPEAAATEAVPHVEPAPSSTRIRLPPQPEASILLVDDSPANLLTLEVVLEPLGHVLVRAQSGHEALELVGRQTFALIVLDVMMPGIDGFQTAALIRERYPEQRIPIIFLSAINREDSDINKGYANGAVDYLVKPFNPEILRSKASVFVELFVQREEIRRQAMLLVAHERERAQHAEQARIHEATRQAERRFRALVNATSQIVWTTNAAGQQVEDSPSWRAFTDQTAQEWLEEGTHASPLHPDDRKRVREAWSEAVAGKTSFDFEYRLRRGDGEYRHVADRGIPVLNEDGTVCEWIGTITDIEDRKRVEAEVEANMILREQLLAIVGHDLQNPLAAILLDSRSMLEGKDLTLGAKRRMSRIKNTADRMARMVTQLLDLSRARMAGGIPVEFQEADLAAICRDTMEELQIAHPERTVVYTGPATLVGRFDADRLSEVVSNLVGNAIQHGGRSPVTVGLQAIETEAVLEVHNEGEPIPAEIFPHLFDPFRRGKRETKSSSLGLGLYIAQQIVAAHAGALTVTSTAESGTRFTATLPLVSTSTET